MVQQLWLVENVYIYRQLSYQTIRIREAHLFTEKEPDELCVGHPALFLSAASCHGSAEDTLNHTRAQS